MCRKITISLEPTTPVKNCELKAPKVFKIGAKTFCLSNYGKMLFQDAGEFCRDLNARLPLPRNKQESDDFVRILPDIGITKVSSFLSVILDISIGITAEGTVS